MKTFTERYKILLNEINRILIDLIEKQKIESNHTTDYCLRIIDEEKMYNVLGGRYIVEVTASVIIDNEGYQYNQSVIDVEEYLDLIDYLIERYS